MTSTTQPPRPIVVAATWWLWLLRVGGWLGGLRRRLRRDRPVRVSVQVSEALIGRQPAVTGWLEQTCRAVFDAQCAPPMPIRVIVTAEAGLPGSHDLGGVRAAYRVTDGPTGRRAIVWLGALQPAAAAQRADDWLAAGLTWALLCLVTWEESQPRLAALPMPGVSVTAPPVAPVRPPDTLGGAPSPAGPPRAIDTTGATGHPRREDGSGAAGHGRAAASADHRPMGAVALNGQPHGVPPDGGLASDSSRPLAAASGEITTPMTTSAPPEALSYPAEE